ncbi:MAG: prepilin-type N-terminal cleavage/methylation domain-containing protein [bacterium]|nr:prepilin-type N-terminal cleavage/methylation domain-containing protein [bacterium]
MKPKKQFKKSLTGFTPFRDGQQISTSSKTLIRERRSLWNNRRQSLTGFTLIELLVVISIIGLLASVVMIALNTSRAKAKNARVLGDLRQLRTAIALLEDDTGKWPNGCPVEAVNNPEVFLDQATAGIKSAPPVGVVENPCAWTAREVAGWKGPYTDSTIDPWGRSYYFDPDYCDENAATRAALLSLGPDGVEQYKNAGCAGGSPSSDDITLYIK